MVDPFDNLEVKVANAKGQEWENYFIQEKVNPVPEAWYGTSARSQQIWTTLDSQYVRPLPPCLYYWQWIDREL